MMMCVAMVTGSGVPVSAAEFASDEVIVENVTEDETEAEIDVENDDTDADMVSVDENEEYADMDADMAGIETDGSTVFSDGETVLAVEDSVQEESPLGGMIVHGDGSESDFKESTVVEKTGTSNKFTWSKEINLTFESADASEEETNTLKFMIYDNASWVVGTWVSSGKVSSVLTPDDDGYYSINLGRGNGPDAKKTTAYCTRTDEDGSTENYKINITRKGYAGIKWSMKYTTSYPLNVFPVTCDTNGEFKSNFDVPYYLNWIMATFYDENGDADNKKTGVSIEANSKYLGNQWYIDEEGYLHTKGACAFEDGLILKYNNTDYEIPVRVCYGKVDGNKLLQAKATDGTTTVNTENFADADAFAGLFPEKNQKDAKEFYTLVTECQAVLEAENGAKWDYLVASNGEKKFWDDDCESAKVNRIIELAPSIWENIYGFKDAEDTLAVLSKQIESASENRKDALTAVLEEAEKKLSEIKKAYEDGTATDLSVDSVSEVVTEATSKSEKINNADISKCTVVLDKAEFIYSGKAFEPVVTVKNGKETVSADNYSVKYENNENVGVATVIVEGKGIYEGSQSVEFTIAPAEQELAVPITSFEKTAGDAAFALNVSAMEGATVTYTSDNAKVATVDENGNVTPVAEGIATITVKATAENYKEVTATVTVKVAKKAVAPVPVETYKILNVTKTAVTKTEGNKAFSLGVKTKVKASVSYKTSAKNIVTVNKNGKVTVKGPGRAVITVTGKAAGLKAETVKITVTVKPSAKLSAKATAQKGKKVKVTWKRNKKATGYQVVIATDKSFQNVVKTVNIKKNKTVNTTLKSLKKGQKYYVRVRSYKKAAGGNIYGNWAKTKPVKAVR